MEENQILLFFNNDLIMIFHTIQILSIARHQ